MASTVGQDLLTLHGSVEQMQQGEASLEDLLRVHTEQQVKRVREACTMAEQSERIVSIEPATCGERV